jgi:hypothetical protein
MQVGIRLVAAAAGPGTFDSLQQCHVSSALHRVFGHPGDRHPGATN